MTWLNYPVRVSSLNKQLDTLNSSCRQEPFLASLMQFSGQLKVAVHYLVFLWVWVKFLVWQVTFRAAWLLVRWGIWQIFKQLKALLPCVYWCQFCDLYQKCVHVVPYGQRAGAYSSKMSLLYLPSFQNASTLMFLNSTQVSVFKTFFSYYKSNIDWL